MIKVVIADDHAMFREGIRMLLEMEQDMEIAGEAGTGREALDLCRALNPDVLLLDLDLPELDGMDVTRQAGAEGLAVKILILTMHTNEEYVARLLQAGASGFVPKYSSSKTLPSVIRSVMQGKTYIPEEMKDVVMNRLINSPKNGAGALSDREMQVFASIVEGLSTKDIAEKLSISPRTVETHKSRLMEKLGLKSTADIYRAAMRMGLIRDF
jgi:two-component system, NarL family, response regulator NreC